MMNEAERKILDMVEQGSLTAEEGLRLINAMDERPAIDDVGTTVEAPSMETISPSEPTHPPIPAEEMARVARLKRWWVLPFGIGLVITTLGAIWMYLGYRANGFGWGFWLAWLPFLLGIFILTVSYRTRESLWLHVRIRQKPGESPARISISLPMPLRLARWFFAVFGDRISGLKDQPLGDITQILETLSPEEPFYVHVMDEDGEEVEVFIG